MSAIAVDASSNVYITANATGLGDYPLNNGFQSYAGGAAYITELAAMGRAGAVRLLLRRQRECFSHRRGWQLDAGGKYLPGPATRPDNLPLVNAYQSTNGGGYSRRLLRQDRNAPASRYIGHHRARVRMRPSQRIPGWRSKGRA